MPRSYCFQPRQPRPARDHVIFRMDLEPEAVRGAGVRLLVYSGFRLSPADSVVVICCND